MNILIYGLNFPPEITGVGKYTGEMTAYLAQKGCQVRVITSYPYYPAWQINEGFNQHKYSREFWPADESGVEVFRCPLWVPSRPTAIMRILHLFSFVFSSLPVCLSQVFWRPDLVLCIAPAILYAPVALFTAFFAGSKSWLHVQDFELEAAWSLGFLKENRFLKQLINRGMVFTMNRFDRISSISDNMVNAMKAEGISPEKLSLFPNWVDLSTIHYSKESNSYRMDLNLTRNDIIVLFSGSMTKKQSLNTVIEAARLLVGQEHIHFVLCGEGATRSELQEKASDLSNVHFLPLQPIEKLNHLMNLADIHLLPQIAAAADLVMPSKVTAILASGRPVVAAAGSNTAIGDLVKKAGVITPPENPAAMADAIAYLAGHPEIRIKMGRNARIIAENRFSASNILSDFYFSLSEFLSV
ncbi:MAG: WcaI family glycosyltransferase [Anaerolineaceae bacterium]